MESKFLLIFFIFHVSCVATDQSFSILEGSGDDVPQLVGEIDSGSGFGPDDEDSGNDLGSGDGEGDDEDDHFRTDNVLDENHQAIPDNHEPIYTSSAASDHVVEQQTVEHFSVQSSTSGPNWLVSSTVSRTGQPSPMSVTQEVTVAPTVGTPKRKNVDPFLKPGILAAVIGGAVVGLLASILIVMFVVYRMRKKDEGSYILDEPKSPSNAYAYHKAPAKEIYA